MSRVLIVEDEAHLADGLRFNLEAEGHEATVTHDGESALKLLIHDATTFDSDGVAEPNYSIRVGAQLIGGRFQLCPFGL